MTITIAHRRHRRKLDQVSYPSSFLSIKGYHTAEVHIMSTVLSMETGSSEKKKKSDSALLPKIMACGFFVSTVALVVALAIVVSEDSKDTTTFIEASIDDYTNRPSGHYTGISPVTFLGNRTQPASLTQPPSVTEFVFNGNTANFRIWQLGMTYNGTDYAFSMDPAIDDFGINNYNVYMNYTVEPTENENVFRIDFEDSTVTQQWFVGNAQLRIRNVRYHALSDTLQYVDINNSTASNPTEFYQKLNDGEFEVDQVVAALSGDSFYFYKGSAYMVYELWKLARS